MLIDKLVQVKAFFPGVINVVTGVNDFSLWRSGRRGAVTEATNQGVDKNTIDLMGRWRKKEKARGTEPGLPMRQVYTEVKNSVKGMLLFAKRF